MMLAYIATRIATLTWPSGQTEVKSRWGERKGKVRAGVRLLLIVWLMVQTEPKGSI